jgi:hypothetical protein
MRGGQNETLFDSGVHHDGNPSWSTASFERSCPNGNSDANVHRDPNRLVTQLLQHID